MGHLQRQTSIRHGETQSRRSEDRLQYKLAFLGNEPSPSFNWCQTITPDQWSCTEPGCPPCAALDRFLAADEEVGRFSMKQRDRDHILRQLKIYPGMEARDQYKTDFRVDTIKTRSPHTLWVSKTRQGHERTRKEWKARARRS